MESTEFEIVHSGLSIERVDVLEKRPANRSIWWCPQRPRGNSSR